MARDLKQRVIEALPLRYVVPLRFHYRRLRGRLEPELQVLPSLLQRRQLAVDIGANFGMYTCLLSKLCVWVEAFEPLPQCARLIEAFGAPNVRVHRVALSSARGSAQLYVPRDRGKMNPALACFTEPKEVAESLRVDLRMLDEYEFRDVSFIKIDVEGHELEVLKGAEQTIARDRPLLLIEIEQRHLEIPIDVVFGFLRDRCYRGSFVEGSELRPLKHFSVAAHQKPFLHDVTSRDYVNNFLFFPE